MLPTQRHFQKTLDSRLIQAVKTDDIAEVRQLLANGANPSAIEVRSRNVFRLGLVKGACDSVLIIAARKGTPESHEVMRALIEAGADASYISNWGETAAAIVSKQRDRLREFGVEGVFLDVLLTQLRPTSAHPAS